MLPGLFGTDRLDRQPKASADGICNDAQLDAFFRDGMVFCAGLTRLEHEPEQTGDVGDMCRRPPIGAIADIGGNRRSFRA